MKHLVFGRMARLKTAGQAGAGLCRGSLPEEALSVDRDPSMPLTGLVNIGRRVAERLAQVGIRTRAELEAVGPVEAYRRMRSQAGPPPSLRHHLFGLDAALMGLPVSDLPRSRRTRLAREALEWPIQGPAQPVFPRHVIRARHGRRGRR